MTFQFDRSDPVFDLYAPQADSPTLPLPAPEPGTGLAGLEPEIAQIVAALESLGQVQPVLLAAVGRGHEAQDHLEIVAHALRKALAGRVAESIGYAIEIDDSWQYPIDDD